MRVPMKYLLCVCLGYTLGALLPPFYICSYDSSNGPEEAMSWRPREPVAAREGCVCGEQANELKRLSKVALQSKQFNIPSSSAAAGSRSAPGSNFIGAGAAPDMSEAQLKEFLYPSNRSRSAAGKHYRPGSSREPKSLQDEYFFKKMLFVGVLTQQAYLPTRAKYLYETWGKEVDKLVFFVGEDCKVPTDLQYLPIVKLPGIPDNVYPPLRKTFAVLQYMHDNHLSQFNWFIRADDDMYVRVKKLKDLLAKMVPYEKVYLGRAGTGREDDLDRLALLPHERYCMGGPGIILSTAALRELGPHLTNCLNAVLQYSKTGYNDDDVEVGRCVSRKISVQCSSSTEVKTTPPTPTPMRRCVISVQCSSNTESRQYFLFDYTGAALNPVTLWTHPSLQQLITIHPIKLPENMLSVHHFYKTLDFEEQYERTHTMVNQLNHLCKKLPPHVAPPLSTSAGCDLKLHPHLAYFNASSKLNHLGAAPSAFLVNRAKVPFYLKPVNKFDVHLWTRFNDSLVQEVGGGLSPEASLKPSFQAEVSHMLGMLRSYIEIEFAPKAVKISSLLDGYVRFNPHLGREYIFTLKLSRGHAYPSVFRTYHMIREVGPQVVVVNVPAVPPSLAVNVILPLPVVDGPSFTEFLRSLAHVGLKHSGNAVHLVVVVSTEQASRLAESALSNFSSNTFPISASIVVTNHAPFNFLRAYDVGMATLQDDHSLAFLTDVKTRLAPGFFRRCRGNPELERRVYFPTPFRLYQSHFQNFSDGSVPAIAPWTGQWAFYDFRAVCVYKKDYMSLNGYRNCKYSVDFFEKVTTSPLDIMRAPEPGLFKPWGQKQCKSLASSRRRHACRDMRTRLGQVSQVELADYLGELGTKEASILNPKKLSSY